MCNFWNAILTRDGHVLWDRNITSHDELITKFGLIDTKLVDRDFVRIEITPNPGKIASKKKCDWTYKLDEPGTAPDWYANDPMAQEKKVWVEWKKAMAQTLWIFDMSKIADALNEFRGIQYLKQLGEPLPEWNLTIGKTWVAARRAAWYAARDAANDAARDAANDAARGAAWKGAWDAANDAARDAAWKAAGKAAWKAVWDAAWDDARDAVWDAAQDVALNCIISILPDDKIATKHSQHVNDRMEVWRRGYALLCDVNGKLYVYGVGKEQTGQVKE